MKAIDLVWISACLALAAAPLDWPYGYYQLLRVMISVIAVFLAIRSWRPGSRAWTWGLAAMALIYNPLAPLSLGRELWTIVNGVSVAVLVMHWWATERQRGATLICCVRVSDGPTISRPSSGRSVPVRIRSR